MLLLESIGSTVLFAQTGHGADAEDHSVFTQAGALQRVKRIYELSPGSGSDLIATGATPFPSHDTVIDAAALPLVDCNPDKVVYLAFTSGTTGLPKGVLHSDNTLLANGRAMVTDWGHNERTVLYCYSPIIHHIGTVAIEQSMTAGCELVLNDPPPGMRPVDWIIASGATYVMGVPTHAMDILADMRTRAMTSLGCVNVFYMAGSTIPPETARTFVDLGIKPQNVYGMTENGSHQYTLPSDDLETMTMTCGHAASGYETRIFDQEDPDRELAPGEVGEIGTRGAQLMLGYYDNQLATEDSFNADRWFMSGDLGRLGERGNLSIVGRKKDMIIRGAHNIHPYGIENLALRHPAVMKAAAFPIADARLGERVCLAVILQDGETLAARNLLDHLKREGLTKYDMPEYYVAMDEFPLTPSGKILKRELTEWARVDKFTPEPCPWD